MRPIFVYGAPASGKSTLGRKLANRLSARFVDLDDEIVECAKKSVSDIFATEGEAAFRELESKALRSIDINVPTVVALGGGSLLKRENREYCEEIGEVLCLMTPSDEEIERRLAKRPGSRPLGNMARERASHYASFAKVIEAVFEVEESLIVVGNGIAGVMTSRFPVVSDATFANLHPALEPEITIPSGEANKTPDTIISLWNRFAELGIGRNDTISACGGGVTGDLTGFAAATWMRGIDWINFPTTLLSMVDASTGGKTGCDLKAGKNLAGAFHSPKLVIIDAKFLETLPTRELASGKAEMIKHCIIGGIQERVDFGKTPSAVQIAENLAAKVEIVKQDPFERKGQRLLLNCGHTVAHAIEKLTNYQVSHGEAVAMGCVEEARIAVDMKLAKKNWPEELAGRFSAAGLSVVLPSGMCFESMRKTMMGDKKRNGSIVTFALPCGWGDVRAVPIDLKGN